MSVLSENNKISMSNRQSGCVADFEVPWSGYVWTAPTFPADPDPSTYDIRVATTGNDTTGDGSIALPYATLEKAKSTATSGQKIYVYAGTYVYPSSSYGLCVSGKSLTWFFEDGCFVNYGSGGVSMIRPVNTNNYIYGHAVFNQSSGSLSVVSHLTADTLIIYCKSMTSSAGDTVSFNGAGNLQIYCSEDITHTNLQEVISINNASNTCTIHCRDIISNGSTTLASALEIISASSSSIIARNIKANHGLGGAVSITDGNTTLSCESISTDEDGTLSGPALYMIAGTVGTLNLIGADVIGGNVAGLGAIRGASHASANPTLNLYNCRVRCKADASGSVIYSSTTGLAVKPIINFMSKCWVSGAFTQSDFTLTGTSNIQTNGFYEGA